MMTVQVPSPSSISSCSSLNEGRLPGTLQGVSDTPTVPIDVDAALTTWTISSNDRPSSANAPAI